MEKVKFHFYDELLSKDESYRLQITTENKLQNEFIIFLIKNYNKYFFSNRGTYEFPAKFVTLKDFNIYKNSLNNKMSNENISLKLSKLEINPNKQNGGLVPKNGILFQKAYTQNADINFIMTNYGCFICQKNFVSLPEYDDHIKLHGKDEFVIPASSLSKCSRPTFVISYDHCPDTNLLNFAMKSNKDIAIEKIVIVRPELRKVMHCVEKSKIQLSKENRTYNFSVNSFLFDRATEHPFFVIYRNIDDKVTRVLEKYIFFRQEEFPKSKISVVSSSVPHNARLVFKSELRQHFPSLEVRDFCKSHYRNILNTNYDMMQYVAERQLNESNYGIVLSFLLQMEDQSILYNYEKLTLTNPALKHLGCLDYSVTFPEKIKNKSDLFVSEFDDIVVSNFQSEGFYDSEVLKSKKTEKGKRSVGYIYKVKNNKIFFSLRTKPDISKPFKVKVYPHRMPLRYQYEALNLLVNYNHILRVLLPPDNATAEVSSVTLSFYNKAVGKNPEQAQAVENIITNSTPTVPYIIFGPPGTGKSTTIVESVLQLWKTKPFSRILVTSGSNAACDEVAKRLCKIFEEINAEGLNLLRIYATSYERKIDNTNELLFEYSNFAHGYHFYPSLDSIYLFRIVVATLSICGKLVQGSISDKHFTHIFIDECAASTESEALVGIVGLMGPTTKLILSGDPKQLGPVLKCEQAENFGFGISMMERLLNMKCYAVDTKTNKYDRSLQTILRRNFRSNANILSISNKLCYNSQLLACANPGTTEWAKGWKNLPSKKCPILFHVVHGETVVEKGEKSSKNLAEIKIVMKYVRDILKNGINGRRVTQNEIGVISPYKKQYTLIRNALDSERYFKVETGSAENFQGQEKPIIIISTVKSWMNIGFLKNVKRLNVMLTRAQALMIIVGNPNSLEKDDNWFQVLQHFDRKNAFIGQQFKLKDSTIQEAVTNYKIVDNYKGMQASKMVENRQNSHNDHNYNINCQQEIKSRTFVDNYKDIQASKMVENRQNSHNDHNYNINCQQEIKSRTFVDNYKDIQASKMVENRQNSHNDHNYNINCQQEIKSRTFVDNYKDIQASKMVENRQNSHNDHNYNINCQQEIKSRTFVDNYKDIQASKMIENRQNSHNDHNYNINCQQEIKSRTKRRRTRGRRHGTKLQNSQKNISVSTEKICNNNSNEINCHQEKLSNLTAEKTNALKEPEELDGFYNVASVHLENSQSLQNNNFTDEYSSNSNNIIQQNILETELQECMLENSLKEKSATSLENVVNEDPIPVPTPFNNTSNNETDFQQHTLSNPKLEKEGTPKARTREEEQIEDFFTISSLLVDDLETTEENNDHVIRPMLTKVPKQNNPFFNRPKCDSFPYGKEWDIKSSYTKCPPLNDYYVKPKIKEESDCVVL